MRLKSCIRRRKIEEGDGGGGQGALKAEQLPDLFLSNKLPED
jgi:hypothetical protein